ncbi:GNAT superfamily N-acetyltransferase [Aequitasia blattaphilus]|uniref:GNAT family N-acetyltransferase n=1 Tax=Aequitasia blattaphilus TaxID=2949332 RepID=A0ABT1E7J0_9FIRM|nr:GNAT family N-acetyltransferase [Aequitasia blattaphilus]MCP1101791.1 GNAT family N-acetyltransferase [Aequitasia blattaphilus]MCR8614431.1 GNAT family N-acetyltransferase [Aequitasia blattaphilus]
MVREVEAKDKELYLEMAQKFYSSEAVLHSIPVEYIEATWREIMRSKEYVRCFFLEKEGQTAGYGLMAFSFSQEAGGKVVWLEELFILPEFRGQGLGTEFFKYVENNVEETVSRVRLEIEPDNVRAKKLYESLGYEGLPYLQMVKE